MPEQDFPRIPTALAHSGLSPRRTFLGSTLTAVAAATAWPTLTPLLGADSDPTRKFLLCLTPGSIGVTANQNEAITLAQRHGFEAVEPYGGHLASLGSGPLEELVTTLKAAKLSWGAAGLPVEFRQGEDRFRETLQALGNIAPALARAGSTRVGTWLSPGSSSLSYLQNFRQHARRLREVARILKDHGQRLGLEYVGTISSRARSRYTFIHTLAETRDLIAEIGTGNVGVVLDSWHWWQAGDSAADILTLKDEDIVSVDLNDAPAQVPKEQQADGKRELPAATGVIDVTSFLGALRQMGYSGPIRAEPFNKALNDLDNEAATAATIAAMRKAVGS